VFATQDYGWSQLARRAGLGWPEATGWAMAQAAEAGFTGWEPLLRGAEDARRVGELGLRHGLAIGSAFVTGPLHDGQAAATIASMLAIARAARAYGCRDLVVYPAPGAKDAAALARQARALEDLGRRVADLPCRLLYHPEAAELRDAGRELHWTLGITDPRLLRVCLDPDTVWMSAADGARALREVIALHGDRVDALHLRQMRGGVGTECLGPGDIDFAQLFAAVRARGLRPRLVVEHVYAPDMLMTMDAVAAHRASIAFLRREADRAFAA
jgi:sugar phosphate isomerase/epimerase